MSPKPILERAFELAASGPSSNLEELRAALKSEGYTDAVSQTSFPLIRKQLREAMQQRGASSETGADDGRKRLTGVLRLSV